MNSFISVLSFRALTTVMLLPGFCLTVPAQSGLKTYRHPAGVDFQYPASWELREQQNQFFLVPSDIEKNAKGQPLELLLLGAQEAEEISSPADPQVADFFAANLRQLVPDIRQTSQATPVSTGLGKGAAFTFAGTDTTGLAVQAYVYVTLYEGTGIYLTYLAPKKIIGKREPAVRRVFASLSKGQRQLDPALVGTWRKSIYVRTAPGSSGTISETTYIYMTFNQDGTAAYAETARMFGSLSDLSVLAQSSGGKSYQGNWRVNNGRVLLTWENGLAETLEYHVYRGATGDIELKIGAPGTKLSIFYPFR